MRFQPSQTEAGAFVWQPAKSKAKLPIIHAFDFVIGRVPFAQDFDGAVEDSRSFGRAAGLVGEAVRGSEKDQNSNDADQRGSLPGKKEGQHQASPSFFLTAGIVWIA